MRTSSSLVFHTTILPHSLVQVFLFCENNSVPYSQYSLDPLFRLFFKHPTNSHQFRSVSDYVHTGLDVSCFISPPQTFNQTTWRSGRFGPSLVFSLEKCHYILRRPVVTLGLDCVYIPSVKVLVWSSIVEIRVRMEKTFFVIKLFALSCFFADGRDCSFN